MKTHRYPCYVWLRCLACHKPLMVWVSYEESEARLDCDHCNAGSYYAPGVARYVEEHEPDPNQPATFAELERIFGLLMRA